MSSACSVVNAETSTSISVSSEKTSECCSDKTDLSSGSEVERSVCGQGSEAEFVEKSNSSTTPLTNLNNCEKEVVATTTPNQSRCQFPKEDSDSDSGDSGTDNEDEDDEEEEIDDIDKEMEEEEENNKIKARLEQYLQAYAESAVVTPLSLRHSIVPRYLWPVARRIASQWGLLARVETEISHVFDKEITDRTNSASNQFSDTTYLLREPAEEESQNQHHAWNEREALREVENRTIPSRQVDAASYLLVCKRAPLPRVKRTLLERGAVGVFRLLRQCTGSLSAETVRQRLACADLLPLEDDEGNEQAEMAENMDNSDNSTVNCGTDSIENSRIRCRLRNSGGPGSAENHTWLRSQPSLDEFSEGTGIENMLGLDNVGRLARRICRQDLSGSRRHVKEEPTVPDQSLFESCRIETTSPDCFLVSAELNQPSTAVEILDDLPKQLIPGIDF